MATTIILSEAEDRPTLYAPEDNVLELDVNTFDRSVYHKPTAFFVEFYSSWCGHCIEYKPLFVEIATEVKTWRRAVVIAVINCADEMNAPVCREHAIDAFPTLKYFHVNSKGREDSFTYKDDKRNVPLVAQRLAEYAKADYDKGLAPVEWPRMEFASNGQTLSALWESAPDVQFLTIIVDKENATNGYPLLLNYAGDHRMITTLFATSHPIVSSITSDLQAPGLIVFGNGDVQTPKFISSSPFGSWVEMQKKLEQFLGPYPKPEEIPLESFKDSPAGTQAHLPSPASVEVNWNQFEVQYQDLIAAMHYMLTIEVPRNPVLGNSELQALKDFIHLIRKHGAGSVPVRRLFFRLDNWLQAQKQPVIATDKYLEKLENLQSELGHPIPTNVSYLACRGSKPQFRGYTCGLWTLFHVLTVQAYKERKDDANFDPVKEVLEPIHQFVVQFLSCEVCSKNFDKMAREDGLLDVNRAEDVALWLWRGHNKVNKRLHGEASEDPKFPKQQFPPASLCPDCRNAEGEFDEQKVLNFLFKYYTDVKIDKYKQSPNYKVMEFEEGKLQKMTDRRLNPKFEPMAGKVDKLEEIEMAMRARDKAQEEMDGRNWSPIDDQLRGFSDRSNYHFLLLVLIAVGLIIGYFQYRRNRSKFWKTFYYYHDYKVLPWQRNRSSPSLGRKYKHNA